MKRSLKIIIIGFALFSYAPRVHAEPMKEFVTSCTYGVLAGTLVGAASLAFTDVPGDNLNNIARGASIGLYAGILLGAYVVYGVPSGDEPEGEQGPSEETPEGSSDDGEQTRLESIYPLFSKNGAIDGAAFSMRILSF